MKTVKYKPLTDINEEPVYCLYHEIPTKPEFDSGRNISPSPEDIASITIDGICPMCESKMIQTPNEYTCNNCGLTHYK